MNQFTDIQLQKTFDREGYVIVDLLSQQDIQSLNNFFSELGHDLDFGFFTSIWSKDKTYREQVNDFIIAKIFPKAQKLLLSYHPVFANYMVKKANKNSALGYHQDWSFSLKNENPAMNFWFPLSDVNQENGTLKIIPGSHQLDLPIRARNYPSPLEKIETSKLDKHAIALKPNLGQAVIFHEKIIHGSSANKSNKTRLAGSLVVASNASTLVHMVHQNEQLFCKKITPKFFTEFGLFDEIIAAVGDQAIKDTNTQHIERAFNRNRMKYELFKLFN